MKHVLASLLLALFLISCGDNDAADGDANDSTAHGGGTADGELNYDSTKAAFEAVYTAMSAGGDLNDLDKYIAADAVDYQAMPGQPQGLAGVKQWATMMRTAFPDLKITLNDLAVEGDKAVALFTITGTQAAPFMDIPSQGKSLNIQGSEWIRLVDGKMVEHWGFVEEMKMMMQLGAMPAPEMPAGGAPAPAAGGDSGAADGAAAGDTTK